MMDEFSKYAIRVSVAQICQTLGWSKIQITPLEVLTDLMQEYVLSLGKLANHYATIMGQTEVNLSHVSLAFKEMEISYKELKNYIEHFDSGSPLNVPKYPIFKENHLNHLKPGSREVLTRPIHIHEHLPPMYQDGMNVLPVKEIASRDSSPDITSPTLPTRSMSIEDLNENSCEDEGQPHREVTSVLMTTSGFLSSAREGKLPDARQGSLDVILPEESQPVPVHILPKKEKDYKAKKNLDFKTHHKKHKKHKKHKESRLHDKPRKDKSKDLKAHTNTAFGGEHEVVNRTEAADIAVKKEVSCIDFCENKENNCIVVAPSASSVLKNSSPSFKSEDHESLIDVVNSSPFGGRFSSHSSPLLGIASPKSNRGSPLFFNYDRKDPLQLGRSSPMDFIDFSSPLVKSEKLSPVPEEPNIFADYNHHSPEKILVKTGEDERDKDKNTDKGRIPDSVPEVIGNTLSIKSPAKIFKSPSPKRELETLNPAINRTKSPIFLSNSVVESTPKTNGYSSFPDVLETSQAVAKVGSQSMKSKDEREKPPDKNKHKSGADKIKKKKKKDKKDKDKSSSRNHNTNAIVKSGIDLSSKQPINGELELKINQALADHKRSYDAMNSHPLVGEQVTKDIVPGEDPSKKKHKSEEKRKLKKINKGKEKEFVCHLSEDLFSFEPLKRVKHEEKPVTPLPKITLKLGPSPPKVNPEVKTQKITIKPVLKNYEPDIKFLDESHQRQDLNQSIIPSSTNPLDAAFPLRPPEVPIDPSQVWICPACNRPDDGSPMIACDLCDLWFHWICVGIHEEVAGDWYCKMCLFKKEREKFREKKKKHKKKKI